MLQQTDLSVMRTLLLLNTTQRKLQSEENIYESDSPLKALQLLKIAQQLNDHLYQEQTVQTRMPLRQHQSPSVVVTQTTIDEVDEDADEDPYLAEIQSAIEVSHIEELEPEVEAYEVAADDEEENIPPIEVSYGEVAEDLIDEDLSEVDIHMLDDSDMPVLSRQISLGSIPSLYHSDASDSEDEDAADDHPDSAIAVQSFLNNHPHSHTHPALNLLTKEYSSPRHSVLHHDQFLQA